MSDMERIESLTHDCSQMAGYLGAISGYLDSAKVPKLEKVHKRVKLFVSMFDELKAENQRLKIMLGQD